MEVSGQLYAPASLSMYPLDSLDGQQSLDTAEKTEITAPSEIEPLFSGYPACSLITIVTELFRPLLSF
jgi:hypothetical protein